MNILTLTIAAGRSAVALRTALLAPLFALSAMFAPPIVASDEIATALRQRLTGDEAGVASPIAMDWPILSEFYARRDYQPLWFDGEAPSSRASHWQQVIRLSAEEGLDPEDYHLSFIETQWQQQTPEQQALLELLLTDALGRYGVHMLAGRVPPEAVDHNWFIPAAGRDAVQVLTQLLGADDFAAALAALTPKHAAYQRLRQALAHYRQLAADGGWPPFPPGPRLELGTSHPQVALLRQRLKVTGELAVVADDEAPFDAPLAEAVRRFQRRHGISVDGIVGADTRAALDVDVAARIDQIRINMERWRWLPRELGEAYILVNTAGYELMVMEDQQPLLTMRVIGGQPRRQTPSFNSVMNRLIFNPNWTVPRRIALEDLVPKERREPGYLQSLDIQVFDGHGVDAREVDPDAIDWYEVNKHHFPYRLVQAPGPNNSLGRIKFSFANAFDIYLHDTPAQGLFNKPQRALSSGCIRVEQPRQLALYLLRDQVGWTNDKIEATIATGNTSAVGLKGSVPIYLVYLTAWVDADGEVNFFKDVYDRDRPVSHRL